MRTRGSVDAGDEEPFSDEQEHYRSYSGRRERVTRSKQVIVINLSGSESDDGGLGSLAPSSRTRQRRHLPIRSLRSRISSSSRDRQLSGRRRTPPSSYDVSLDHFVIDHGARGKCHSCERFYSETASINNKAICRTCFSKNHPNNSTAKFEKSDAKFRCIQKCGAENLSFDEFFVGTCCVGASTSFLHRIKKFFLKFKFFLEIFFQNSFTQKLYEESREKEGIAEIKAEKAEKKVKACKRALDDAEKEAKEALDDLSDKKKWRKKVQKRALLVATKAMKEDNSDLENEIEAENGDRNSDQQTDTNKETCTVCFEIYGVGDRQKSAIFPCGHQACYGCLSSLPPRCPSLAIGFPPGLDTLLPQKSCPTCRADFTDDKILKLFPSTQN